MSSSAVSSWSNEHALLYYYSSGACWLKSTVRKLSHFKFESWEVTACRHQLVNLKALFSSAFYSYISTSIWFLPTMLKKENMMHWFKLLFTLLPTIKGWLAWEVRLLIKVNWNSILVPVFLSMQCKGRGLLIGDFTKKEVLKSIPQQREEKLKSWRAYIEVEFSNPRRTYYLRKCARSNGIFVRKAEIDSSPPKWFNLFSNFEVRRVLWTHSKTKHKDGNTHKPLFLSQLCSALLSSIHCMRRSLVVRGLAGWKAKWRAKL